MKNPIGIMQGRLSPPVSGTSVFPWATWEQEFARAKEIGFDLIDWLVPAENISENPLLTAQGVKTIEAIVSRTLIPVGVVCAHYFVNIPLLTGSDAERKECLERLELLIQRAKQFGARYIEIPLSRKSEIKDEAELRETAQVMKPLLKKAVEAGVTISFESSLTAGMFREFLSLLDSPAGRACYDTGNSASRGYSPQEELEAYGELVATVHIKDRVRGGGGTPLGEGDTDFATCFSMLRARNYAGPFTLETAKVANEVEVARENLAFLKKFLG
ncbi:sugar phosphate isomerase/epimerase family protein [Chloroflexota bacterium]